MNIVKLAKSLLFEEQKKTVNLVALFALIVGQENTIFPNSSLLLANISLPLFGGDSLKMFDVSLVPSYFSCTGVRF